MLGLVYKRQNLYRLATSRLERDEGRGYDLDETTGPPHVLSANPDPARIDGHRIEAMLDCGDRRDSVYATPSGATPSGGRSESSSARARASMSGGPTWQQPPT